MLIASPLFIVTLLLPALVTVLLLVLLSRTRAKETDALLRQYPALAAMRSSVRTTRLIALLVAAVAGFLLLGSGFWLPALAPAVVGLILLGAVLVGEWRFRSAAQSQGVASLERRRISDYVPAPTTVLLGIGVAVLAVALVLGTVLAADDGRSYAWDCTVPLADGSSAALSGSAGPFPGAPYGVLLGLGVLVVTVAAVLMLRRVAGRPRNGSDPALVALDDGLRAQSADGVLGALGLTIAMTLVGVGLFGFVGLRGPSNTGAVGPDGAPLGNCGLEGLASTAHWWFVGSLALGVVALLLSVTLLLWSSLRSRA